MNLSTGERVPWPTKNFISKKSDVLATMNGFSLIRIPAELELPGLSIELIQRLELELIATQDVSIELKSNTNKTTIKPWLKEELLIQLSNSSINPSSGITNHR
jgi:hypothetical protein